MSSQPLSRPACRLGTSLGARDEQTLPSRPPCREALPLLRATHPGLACQGPLTLPGPSLTVPMGSKRTHPWAVAAARRMPTDSANTCTAWAGSLVRPPRAPLQPAGGESRPGRPPAWGPRARPPLPLGLSGARAEGPSSSSLGAVLEAWPPPVQGAGSSPGRGPGPGAGGAGCRSEAGPGTAGPFLRLWPRLTVASPGPGFRG